MRRLTISVALFVFLNPAAVFSAIWKPVTDADLQMKTPQVQKDADAEAIFWEVKVHDEAVGGYLQTTRFHYLRLKIFTERGRDHAKVELTYGKKSNISGVS